MKESENEISSVVSDSLWPSGLYSPWISPGQNTRMGSHSLLQGNLPNPGMEPRSPTLLVDSLSTELSGKPDATFQMMGAGQGFVLARVSDSLCLMVTFQPEGPHKWCLPHPLCYPPPKKRGWAKNSVTGRSSVYLGRTDIDPFNLKKENGLLALSSCGCTEKSHRDHSAFSCPLSLGTR